MGVIAFRNPPPVHPNVAGKTFMLTEDAKRHLGKAAFKIWPKLIHNRQYDGILKGYVTNEKIAELTGYSLRTVEDAMRRMRNVGLIDDSDQSFSTQRVDANGDFKNFKVFRRRVYGDWREGQIFFPRRVAEAIGGLPGHGGARQGSGRKPVEEIKYVGETESSTWARDRREIDIFSLTEKRSDSVGPLPNLKDTKVRKVVPPYPSAEIFHIPKTPDPPLLPEKPDPTKDALTLIKAYRGAFESRHKKKCFILSRVNIEESRYYDLLVKAAELLREYQIAPCSWCAWSMDFWKFYIEEQKGKKVKVKGKAPPLTLVFSEKFISERRGHFRGESLSYLGGTLMFPRSWHDVCDRYNGMMWDFRVEQPDTQLKLAHIVEKWFPGGWENYYRRVRDEAQHNRAVLQKLLMRGEWLWS